jgi:predicted DNA-binding transcriptional regulator AlpA
MPDATRLWTKLDIAEYMNTSVSTVSMYMRDYSFPRPIRLPNGRGGVTHPRWQPKDVMAWVQRYTESW